VDNPDALKRDLGESMFRALDLGSILQKSILAINFHPQIQILYKFRVATFSLTKHTKTGENMPNEHKMCPNGFNIFHMAVKYS
jgi:hypothetical protein